MKTDKTVFILNPISGIQKFRRKRIERKIKKYIEKHDIEAEIWRSKYAGHTTDLVKKAVDLNIARVVVAGGDGSINEAARSLVYADTSLGIIPSGSGNGLAHYLKIPFNIKKALDIIFTGTAKYADVLKVNDKYAFSLAGIGLDAMVAKRYKSLQRRGFFTYLQSAIVEYFNYKPERFIIKYDDKELTETCAFIVFANSDQYGYNFRIAPQADLFDGYIDVVMVKKIPIVSAPLSSIQIFTGRADKILYFSTFKTKKIEIIRDQKGVVNIDGDPYETEISTTVEVIEKALKIIVSNE
ncbi:MAG: diacylglycerol kinase family lipid kinase [Bacteroidales bacterium]|jgi:YegS/Rv2252/BmrU family lipid kinase|nr:diacylglycerol kinase family lipid kinase [Bacteroidales bacterium]